MIAYSTPSTSHCTLSNRISPRELYLRALEQERDELLAQAYASNNDDFDSDEEPIYDQRGRQQSFAESVKQRQSRLEYIRRQEFARRLASRGLQDSHASSYVIKRLPPPRARPAERINAAIKIQRVYRAYRAVSIALEEISELSSLLSLACVKLSATVSRDAAGSRHTSKRGRRTARTAQLNSALALREHADSLSLVKVTFADIVRPSTATSHPRVRAACAKLASAIATASEDLERAKAETWMRELRYASSRSTRRGSSCLGSIVESDSESEESSSSSDSESRGRASRSSSNRNRHSLDRKPRIVVSKSTLRLARPVSRSPSPSLHSILEEEDQ